MDFTIPTKTLVVSLSILFSHSIVEPPQVPPEEPALPPPPVVEEAETIPELIAEYTEHFDADPRLTHEIARCESGFKNVCNTGGCTYGIGPYQFIRSTFDKLCEGDVHNPEDNVRCGIRLISEGKISHWGTPETEWGSYQCWKRVL